MKGIEMPYNEWDFESPHIKGHTYKFARGRAGWEPKPDVLGIAGGNDRPPHIIIDDLKPFCEKLNNIVNYIVKSSSEHQNYRVFSSSSEDKIYPEKYIPQNSPIYKDEYDHWEVLTGEADENYPNLRYIIWYGRIAWAGDVLRDAVVLFRGGDKKNGIPPYDINWDIPIHITLQDILLFSAFLNTVIARIPQRE